MSNKEITSDIAELLTQGIPVPIFNTGKIFYNIIKSNKSNHNRFTKKSNDENAEYLLYEFALSGYDRVSIEHDNKSLLIRVKSSNKSMDNDILHKEISCKDHEIFLNLNNYIYNAYFLDNGLLEIELCDKILYKNY